jgi:hypothetical protein
MNFLENYLKKLAHIQVEHPYLSLTFILLLSIIIFGGISQVKTVASLEQMMPKDIEEIKAFNTLRDNGLGQDMLAIIISRDRNSVFSNGVTDILDYSVYQYSNDLRKDLEQEPDILKSYSFVDIFDMYYSSLLDKNQFDSLSKNPQLTDQLKYYVNSNRELTVIILRTDVSADDSRMNLLASKIKTILSQNPPPKGLKVELTGTPIIQQKLGELIDKDRENTKWISLGIVFLVTVFVFRSVLSAIIPIIVVFISVNWLYGTMGYFSLPISTLAGGVAAMVVGIGIDFAIHIMNKFKLERKKGESIAQATECSIVQTGTALIATSITTIFAFLTFMVGVMPEMGRFGLLMAIGITYSLVFSLFGLPAILIIEENIIYALKSKLRFGIEHEFVLKEAKK